MSAKESEIKAIIAHFMKSRVPLYVNRFMYRCLDEQKATLWLAKRKFIRNRIVGDSYELRRSKTFYDTYYEILKDKTPKQIYMYLKEKFQPEVMVKNVCPKCESVHLKYNTDFSYTCSDCGYTSEAFSSRGQRKKAMLKKVFIKEKENEIHD